MLEKKGAPIDEVTQARLKLRVGDNSFNYRQADIPQP
jgi:hypothetical protein